VQIGTVESSLINESSGIAASRENSDVLWTHNDAGDSARVFAMNTEGAHLGIYYLSVAGATDWEDMAIGSESTDVFSPGLGNKAEHLVGLTLNLRV
jgi:hypothetical protein